MDFMTIFYAILAAAGYGMFFYIKARIEDKEPFDKYKFMATMLMAAFIGGLFAVLEMPVTQQDVESQLAIYFVYIVFLENLFKMLFPEKIVSALKRIFGASE